MSISSGRVRGVLASAASTVTQDVRAARDGDHGLLHGLRFLAEIPATFGLALRQLCYFFAAVTMETFRNGEQPVFDDDYNITARWSWLGPGWEYDAQSRWEIRLAAAYCVLTGVVLHQTIAHFHLSMMQRVLLWATCGTLVLEPAWARLYFASISND